MTTAGSSLRVHLLRDRAPANVAFLRARLAPGVILSWGQRVSKPCRYEILVAGRPRRSHITASPELRALVVPYAGLPAETRSLMLDFPCIAVHNLHHNAAAAAEMAVTLMLAAAKAIVPSDRALREHDWRPRYRSSRAVLLGGKTALIVGYGAIGMRVAKLCRGLGMDVLAVRRRASVEDPDHVRGGDALGDLLPRADALIIAVPLTDETRGLIGAEELALLPPESVLVNVARGPVVDEGALYRSLEDRTLLAAGLDVWYNYPEDEDARPHTRPSAYPFHLLDNVVMSPHRAGSPNTEEVERLRMHSLARLLNAAASGDPMPNRVDVERGY